MNPDEIKIKKEKQQKITSDKYFLKVLKNIHEFEKCSENSHEDSSTEWRYFEID